jgi:hypothetical protein
MPLFVQSAFVELNQTKIFTFPGPIRPGYYAVGGSEFNLGYPEFQAHNVRRINMSMTHGQQDQNSIYVTVRGALNDDNGHAANPKSFCGVVAMAWVGSSDTPTVQMQNLTGVSSSYPHTVPMPANAVLVFTFLAGLSVELQAEQKVSSYSAACSANVNTVDSTISITGGSMLNGVEGTVDVGLLVLTDAKAPYQMFTKTFPSDGDWHQIDFKEPVAAVVSPTVSFGGQLAGGPGPVLTMGVETDHQDATFPTSSIQVNWEVRIWDNSGAGTENGNTNALVIGVKNNSFSGAMHRMLMR